MLEYAYKNENEQVCNVFESFLYNDVESISIFNKEEGNYMREEKCIPLVVNKTDEKSLKLVVDIYGGKEKNFFIVIENKREPKFFEDFSDAYEFYKKRKELITLN